MSTRSYICKENEDGTYTGVDCHSDGYLTYNGAMLLDFYSSREKVEKLLSLGDLSLLCAEIEPNPELPHNFDFDKRQDNVCVFYGRDRGEDNVSAQLVKLEEIDSPDSWIEYCYIFTKDNEWKYFECGNLKKEFKDVKKDLDKEYKKISLKERPTNCYGFFTKEELEKIKKQQESGAEAC